MNEKDLLRMKEEIDRAKSKVSELTGKQKHLLAELKDKWECSSIEEAERYLKKLEREIKGLDIKIDESIKDIQERYNFTGRIK
jgi:hypothetical protein